METSRRHAKLRPLVLTAAAVAAAVALGIRLPARAADVAESPMPGATHQPTPRAPSAIATDLKETNQSLAQAITADTLSDPAQRAAAAPTVIPLVRREGSLLDEMSAARHLPPAQFAVQRQMLASMLYVLADQPTVARTDAASAHAGTPAGLQAQAVQLHARWLAAGHDPAAQQAVADDLDKLDLAHPDDGPLTLLTATLGMGAATPTLQSHLMAMATETMKNPTAVRLQQTVKVMQAQRKAQAEADAKETGLEGKPLDVAGPTVGGKAFTSADYRGKVVLVDFWATWCPPCRAELPHVKDIYGKYHDKGLEIVGVSNDFDAAALTTYTAQNGMPWPELFDADAAAQKQWNPVTTANGINGIPTMFLIDKKGVCRSVTARETMDQLIPTLLAE